jgi:hypothetical protein
MTRFHSLLPGILAGALACTLPDATLAQASSVSLRAGAWQVRSGAPGQPMVGYTVCLKNGAEDLSVLLPKAQVPPDCPAPAMQVEGDELLWTLSCPAHALAARARYTLAPEKIDGRLGVSSGKPPKNSEQVVSASYTGACAPP